MLEKLSIIWFLVAFAAGIALQYVSAPAPRVVYKFPNPQTAGTIVFKDNSDGCFKYEAQRTSCPASGAEPQPVDAP